jgi:hypothetical protein
MFRIFLGGVLGAGAFFVARANGEDAKKKSLPPVSTPAATRTVDFDADVKPILMATCVECHGNGKAKGGLRIDTRQTFLKGGDGGPAAIVGDGAHSLAVQLVAGLDDDRQMPKKGRKLTADEVGVLRAWVDQGMKWPDGVTFAAGKPAPLSPRTVALPAGADANANPIDALLVPYFAKHHVKAGEIVGDEVFARRVWLDTIGLLPPPADLQAFVADAAPDKREKLVRRLLNDTKGYTEHWLSFWNDLLRNDYKGTGYIDGGRKQITPWLYQALSDDVPFDRFVRELITGANGAEGFTKGIVWRGVVNAAQTPQMQAAQNISQVFMGANLKCASCHDSFISQWTLADSYGLAGIFADKPLEMERCSVPLKQVAPMKFLYPELGAIDPKAPKATRLAQLADAIISEKNGRLSRTIVNRLWKRFLGRAIVEPVDEMDRAPWDADLLDWLAEDLAKTNGWDLKKTMARILTSGAYQMPIAAEAEGGNERFVFRGPTVRRMTAEQFVDALSTVTGVWTGRAAYDPANPTPAKKDPKAEPAAAAPVEARAALCSADPLTTALGRTNREQVLTDRQAVATTLQGLEMSNGKTLAEMLSKAAAKLAADRSITPDGLVGKIFDRALSRKPTAGERQTALELLGNPVRPEGVEDLLWIVAMLPEFQLIR